MDGDFLKDKTPMESKAWVKLFELMDNEVITALDLLAVVCTKFNQCKLKKDTVKIMIQGQEFKITLEKV